MPKPLEKAKKLDRLAVKQVSRVFWQHAKRYPIALVLLYTSVVTLHTIQVIIPWYFKLFFDALAKSLPAEQTGRELMSILFIITGLFTVNWVLRRVRGFASAYFQARVMTDLMQTSFNYLIRHSYRFFTDNFAGSLTRKINRISRAFEEVNDRIENDLLPLVVTVSGILFVLFKRNTYLGAALAIGVAVFITFHYFVARWKQRYDLAKAKKDSETTGVLADALSNSNTIKLFTGFAREQTFFNKVTEELYKIRLFSWNLSQFIDTVQGALMLAIQFTMLYFAITFWQRGILTIGDFALIQLYLITLFDRIWDFGRVLRRIFEGFADAAEMVEILELPHEIKDKINAQPLLINKGDIELKEIDFSFQKTRKILDKFSLTIKAGEKVALVGPSGAGKTTIVQLLFRFFDVDGGEILIDGQNIAKVTQDSLRDHISLVPQEPVLFHRTLAENILYGRPGASEAELKEAAKKARCHDFISSLPDGYHTYVGERGIKLSGGERQRVAIARAILKNAPILVLDEATSSLDSESEALIQEALAELMRGKTTIVIAHRLSTIMQMDRIVVIDEGKVVASNTHAKLLAEPGIYKKLWEIQRGGFIR